MPKRLTKPAKTPTRTTKKSGSPAHSQPATPKRPDGKLGLILKRVEAKTGATLGDLVKLTGWQQHTVHGALSRLRTRGFGIRSEVTGQRKVYRLAGPKA
jgi:hypothetical protein